MGSISTVRTNHPMIGARLTPVRNLILESLPEVQESRVHFYLVYHLGSLSVAKLHLDAKGQPNVTFVTGSELADPSKLLKGSSLVRTIKVKSEAYLAQNREGIVGLLRLSFDILKSRWDGKTQMTTLRPDQPSP